MAEDDPVIAEYARTMGAHLRAGRRRRYPHDTQDDFARRIGVARYTYQKMEQGDTRVAMGRYLRAAALLDVADRLVEGLAPPPRSFFDDG